MSRRSSALLTAIPLCAAVAPLRAAVVQEQRITPTPRITSQIFGLTLDFDGVTIGAGAGFENNTFTGAGAAYLFTRNAGVWTQQLRLFDPSPEFGGSFGSALELEGPTLLVSAPGHSASGTDAAGLLYAYELQGAAWTLVQTIEPTTPIEGGFFADAIALEADLLAVGAWASAFPSAGGFADRLISIYERVAGQWQHQATLAAPAAYSNGFTATADVAVDGGRVFVGGSRELTPGGIDAGAVFVIEKIAGTWQQTATIRPADASARFEFGASVAADAGRVAIGAQNETEAGLLRAGAVYLHEFDGGAWTLVARLTSDVLDDNDYFGVDIALRGNTLVIGAQQADPLPFSRHGYAKVFHLGGLTISAPLTLEPADGEPHDIFGWAVAVHGDRAVIAAPFETTNRGAAYIFTGVGLPCPADINRDGTVGLADLGAILSNYGLSGPGLDGDFDFDDDVDLSDLGVLLSAFGIPCL